jgi:hypothetical protein
MTRSGIRAKTPAGIEAQRDEIEFLSEVAIGRKSTKMPGGRRGDTFKRKTKRLNLNSFRSLRV